MSVRKSKKSKIRIPVKKGLKPNYIKIDGISKGQYWLDDSTGVKVSSRTVKI